MSDQVQMPPGTAVVVVTYGSPQLLERNLATIDLAAAQARAVIVDNLRSTAEREVIRAMSAAHGWIYTEMAGNAGFGVAVNRGAEMARTLGCDHMLMLNPDAVAPPEVIRGLVAESRSHSGRALVSPRIVRPDGRHWFRGSYLDERTGGVGRADAADPRRQIGWLTGAALAVDLDFWDELGGFDDDYFLYWEDIDLSRRCVAAGGRLVVRDDLVAVHEVGATQSGGGKSSEYFYYNCRNRLVFAAKHLPRRQLLRWLMHTPAAGRRIVLRGGRRTLLAHPSLVWAGVRGSWAGLWHAIRALARPRGSFPVAHPWDMAAPHGELVDRGALS